jgi:glutamate carboxypeptidase
MNTPGVADGSTPPAGGVLAALRAQQDEMVSALAAMTERESPSGDAERTTACADLIADLGQKLLGAPATRGALDGHPYLRWCFGEPRVLLLGHLDTVWPVGTLQRWPFSITDGVATGPGAFDMKAGLVQLLYGLATLPSLTGVDILITSDEEIGSPASRPLIESLAAAAEAVLVLEPSSDGALKVARKGIGIYQLEVHGRAAHAGLEPERGINATVELAHQVLALQALADPQLQTTVTPTMVRSGEAGNQVPALAELHVDVRAFEESELIRVDHAVRSLQSHTGATFSVRGGINRPAMESSGGAEVYRIAEDAASRLGLPPLGSASVGGASDGNFAAAMGTATLDGLGAVGGGAHAEGEHVVLAAMPERAALVATVVGQLLSQAVSG